MKDPFIRKIIIISVATSFLVGGVAGGILGILTGTTFKDNLVPWFKKNILRELTVQSSLSKSLTNQNDNQAGVINVEENSATVEAVQKVSPAVVSIIISKDLSKIYNLTGPNLFPFEDFFGSGFQFSSPQGQQEIGGGTGFIITTDGLILTNKHVVSDAEAEYTVLTNDGQRYSAKVVATDPFFDLGMVKIDAKNLPTVELGDSDKLKIGQTVIAIGNSLGEYRNTVTKGIISGIGRTVTAGDSQGSSETLENVIQTDAAINKGNSGGPLIDLSGQVVGINTAIDQSGQLIGFAIPINSAKDSITSVREKGKISRPFLGVRYTIINSQIAKANNLSFDYGALLVKGTSASDLAVIPGGPADKAGLVENDIILEFAGEKITETNSLAKMIQKHKPGDEIALKVYHDGRENEVKVTLSEAGS